MEKTDQKQRDRNKEIDNKGFLLVRVFTLMMT